MGLFEHKDKHEFKPLLVEIEERPVNPLGRVLLWIIIVIIIFGALWLYFAKVDIVVSASGTVIPNGKIKTIQAMDKGVISEILVKEGDYVKKDQPLIIIDKSVNESNLKTKQERLETTQLEIERIRALINNKKFIIPDKFKNTKIAEVQKTYYKSLKSSHENLINKIEKQINSIKEKINIATLEAEKLDFLTKSALKRVKKLETVKDIIANKEFEDAYNNYMSLQKQLFEKKHEISQLKSELEGLKAEKRRINKEFENKLLEELVGKRKEMLELETQIKEISFKNRKLIIRSPIEGYINEMTVNTVGGIVTPAQKLLSIVPKDVPLIVRAKVTNKDIGFIKENMNSIIKIDTYDFQKYGYLNGKVSYISKDAIEDKNLGMIYIVDIKPDRNYLLYNGQKLYIFPGMSTRVEIKTGKRRVIEFFIYPLIKYLNESISIR